ncbi:unnamed protein product [Sphagnum troendelagicum]|uniref:Uncharacterized protein n=1 Tax=Sphagnum troendelagicum TaxID=128251 RepID=A0ABP0TSM3_9BRYO
MANWRLLMKLMIMAVASMGALTRALEQLSSHRSPYARRHPLRRSRMQRSGFVKDRFSFTFEQAELSYMFVSGYMHHNQAAIKSYPVESIAPSACTGDDGAHLGSEGMRLETISDVNTTPGTHKISFQYMSCKVARGWLLKISRVIPTIVNSPLAPSAPLSKNVASDNATQNLNAWKGPLVLLPSYPVDEDMEDNSCRLATMRMAVPGAGGQFLDLVVKSSHLHSLQDLLIMTIYTKF